VVNSVTKVVEFTTISGKNLFFLLYRVDRPKWLKIPLLIFEWMSFSGY
jgi:hypothetical protein